MTHEDYCDGCLRLVAMVYPDVEGDEEWIPFDPAIHNEAWCKECGELLNQYFYGSGSRRTQARSWRSDL
jgi:hypothetical protein